MIYNSFDKIPHKPPLPTPEDERRGKHTAMRRRMVTGLWEEDLREEMQKHFSQARYANIGVPDMSSNVLEQITRQLSVLYSNGVTVSHTEDITGLTGRNGLVTIAGLWPLMQRSQQLTLALRDSFVLITPVKHIQGQPTKHPGVQYRLQTGDYVYCESAEDAPDVPMYFMEQRLRRTPEKTLQWVADVYDIRDPKNPMMGMFKIEQDGSLGEDVSQMYMGTPIQKGDDYPYRSKEGEPFLPLVMYRAQKTGHLWNAYDGATSAWGALSAATLMSWWVKNFRDSSWAQKYVAGLTLGTSGIDQEGMARRQAIDTDPSSILVFHQDPELQGSPLIGAFETASDPQKMMEALAMYEYRVCTSAGLASSVMKQSGDPRSGYALSVSREQQRESSRQFALVFQQADQLLLAKTAMITNRFLGTSFPESGYRVAYHQLPKSAAEQKEDRENIIQLLNAGLISPVEAMQKLHPDMDEQAAKDHLNKIRRDRAEFL